MYQNVWLNSLKNEYDFKQSNQEWLVFSDTGNIFLPKLLRVFIYDIAVFVSKSFNYSFKSTGSIKCSD